MTLRIVDYDTVSYEYDTVSMYRLHYCTVPSYFYQIVAIPASTPGSESLTYS